MAITNTLLSLLLFPCTISSYTTTPFLTRRYAMTMRKGRKSLRKTVGTAPGKSVGSSPTTPMPSSQNWIPIPNLKTLPDLTEGQVQIIETQAFALIDKRTNPAGAVSVVKYGGQTYCLSAGCSTCKIPLTKAKVLEANEETGGNDPRILCDFCGSTFNIRTGEPVADAETSRGMMGGIVKGIFSSKKKDNIPTYDLGEKNGQVFINIV